MANPFLTSELFKDDGSLKEITKAIDLLIKKAIELQKLEGVKVTKFRSEMVNLRDVMKGVNTVSAETKEQIIKTSSTVEGLTVNYKKALAGQVGYKTAQEQLKKVQRDFNREIKLTVKQNAAAKGSYDDLSVRYSKLKAKINATVDITKKLTAGQRKEIAQLNKLHTAMDTYQRKTGKAALSAGKYENALKNLGRQLLGALGVVGGMQMFIKVTKDAFKVINDFDKNMKKLSSITGLTGKELDFLGQRAIKMSLMFGTSAKDITEAMALVGSAKPELLKNADALAEVTKQAEILAKAGGLTLPEAAAALTKSMNQFGASAADAARFTDILATSQQLGTARIPELSEAMKNAGATARAMGLSFEDTNVLLQALAKGGIEGAEAGTRLRSTLLKLAKTGRDDLNPATTSMSQILHTLAGELDGDVNAAMEIFGEKAAGTALTLIDQRDVVDDLGGKLFELGNALDQASINADTFDTSINKLKASWAELVLTIDSGDGAISRVSKTFIGQINSSIRATTRFIQGDAIEAYMILGAQAFGAGGEMADVLDKMDEFAQKTEALKKRGNPLFEVSGFDFTVKTKEEIAAERALKAAARKEQADAEAAAEKQRKALKAEALRVEKDRLRQIAQVQAKIDKLMADSEVSHLKGAERQYARTLQKLRELAAQAAALGLDFDLGKFEREAGEALVNSKSEGATGEEGAFGLGAGGLFTETEEDKSKVFEILDLAKNLTNSLKDTFDEFKDNQEDEPSLWDIFMGEGEKGKALKEVKRQVTDQLKQFGALQAELAVEAERRSESRVQQATSELQAIAQLAELGYAVNVSDAEKNLELEKESQRRAIENRKKAQRQELAIASITQATNMITASTKIWGQFGNPFIAIPMIALMWGSFFATKARALKLINKKEFSKGGTKKIGGGSHASGNDTIIYQDGGETGTAERGEMHAVFTPRATRKYEDIIESFVQNANRGTLANYLARPSMSVNVNTKKMENSLTKIVKNTEHRETYFEADGTKVTIRGNKTTRKKPRHATV